MASKCRFMESGKIYGAIYANNFNEEEDVCSRACWMNGEFRVRCYLCLMENLPFLIFNRIIDRCSIGKLSLLLYRWGNRCINNRTSCYQILNWMILNY